MHAENSIKNKIHKMRNISANNTYKVFIFCTYIVRWNVHTSVHIICILKCTFRLTTYVQGLKTFYLWFRDIPHFVNFSLVYVRLWRHTLSNLWCQKPEYLENWERLSYSFWNCNSLRSKLDKRSLDVRITAIVPQAVHWQSLGYK